MKKKIYIIYKTIIIIKPNQSLLVIINDKQTDRKTGRGERRECIVMNVSTVVIGSEEWWFARMIKVKSPHSHSRRMVMYICNSNFY